MSRTQPITFEEAAQQYRQVVGEFGPGSDVPLGKPTAEKSRLVGNVWWIGDQFGGLLARVSSNGVRFAGWRHFA